ncbi:MAG: gliding motility-associated C-terminal domain-containing protein, partial [Chitinophagaceae bacterium]|nr:gliding motility-associated C-terminal domain-containing protein [Chitinophagaceae bacterium]
VAIADMPAYFCEESVVDFKPNIFSISEAGVGATLNYKWNFATGNSSDISDTRNTSFIYKEAGVYKPVVTVTSPYGCVATSSREILVRSKVGVNIKVPSDLDVCEESSIPVTVTGAYSYLWINYVEGLSDIQSGAPILSPVRDAVYTVVGFDEYKCSTDTAQVKIKLRPLPSVNAGADVEVVANTEQQLSATGSSDVINFTWTPSAYLSCNNCSTPIVRPKKSTSYVVKVRTVYDCIALDTIRVKLQCLNGYIYIPNSFTPNRDGKNEIFYIKGKGIGIITSFTVFNRWGDKVFQRKNFEIDERSAGWDGLKNGQPVPAGTYVYVAEMQCESGGEVVIKKGTVTVLY